jgi:small subunit ribosomal protein S18
MENDNEQQDNHGGPRRRYFSRPRTCQSCSDKNLVINYKDTQMLSSFVTREGKIRPRRQTGTCAKHQRSIARAVKQARHLALLPYTGEKLS